MVYNNPLSVSFETLFLYRTVITTFYISFNSYKVPRYHNNHVIPHPSKRGEYHPNRATTSQTHENCNTNASVPRSLIQSCKQSQLSSDLSLLLTSLFLLHECIPISIQTLRLHQIIFVYSKLQDERKYIAGFFLAHPSTYHPPSQLSNSSEERETHRKCPPPN